MTTLILEYFQIKKSFFYWNFCSHSSSIDEARKPIILKKMINCLFLMTSFLKDGLIKKTLFLPTNL